MTTWATVETERLVLRPWEDDDRDGFITVFTKPELLWYPMRRAMTADEASDSFDRIRAHWDEHGFGMWAAHWKEEDRVIGFIGLAFPFFLPEVMPAVEVGWRIDTTAWGRGLATEGGAASLRHGFVDRGLDRIISIYEPDNVASGRVMEKLGMHLERETVDPKRDLPLRVLELTRDEWLAAQATTSG